MSMQDKKKPTNCTTSKCPWAAAKCSGMSSPILVAFTRAPRERNISTSLRCPSLAHQCSGLNPWSSLPIKTRKKIFNQSTFFSHLNKFHFILSRRKSILLKHLFICDFVIVSIQKKKQNKYPQYIFIIILHECHLFLTTHMSCMSHTVDTRVKNMCATE